MKNIDPLAAKPVAPANGAAVRSTLPDWTEPPVPLDAVTAPSWPSGVFRGTAAEMVESLSRATQTPRDAVAMFALGVASIATGGRFVVAPRPADPSWREPVNLYVVVAMPPGERKTGIVGGLGAPLRAWETAQTAALASSVAYTSSALRAAAKAREKAENALSEAIAKGKADAREKASTELQRCTDEELDAAAKVVRAPRLITEDATPEALASLLAEQRGRMALLSDEGGGVFEMIAGRYDATPNQSVYLKGHDGTSYRVDRKGRMPEHIDRTTLTVALATQPSTLRTLASKPEVCGRGLLARFLYCIPHALAGYRDTEPPSVDLAVTRAWSELVTELLDVRPDVGHQPHTLTLSPEAAQGFAAWRAEMEPTLRPDGALGGNDRLREWGAKLVGAVARVAALLHLLDHPREWDTPIDLDTVERAIALAGYLSDHAKAAFGVMGDTPGLVGARKLLAWVRKHKHQSFKVTQALRALDRNGTRHDVVDPVLAVLLAHGWIREAPEGLTRGPGRPSEQYLVHPHAHTAQ